MLLKDGKPVDDPFVALMDGEDLPDGQPVIVGLERWRQDRDRLIARNLPSGVRLEAGEAPFEIADDLDRLSVVALVFPKFNDGRAYSSARLLRERHAYTGEVRAVGNVLRDQLMFMHRCGFDAYELDPRVSADDWIEAINEITVRYQPATDGRPTAAALRHRGLPESWSY